MIIVNKYEKNIMFKVTLIKVFCGALLYLNWLLPFSVTGKWQFSVFRIFSTISVILGLLAATGRMCINTYRIENGMTIFEQNTAPLIMVAGLTRIAQVLYYILAKRSVNWPIIIFLIVMDVICIAIILLDKASYGYGLEEEEKIYRI